MKTLLVFLSLITLVAVPAVSAQCNNKLVEQAAALSGKETLIIREFKVKLAEGSMDKPLPVGRYSVMLNEGTHYRIALANSDLSEGRGVVQLYDKTVLLGSSYDTETDKEFETFDFLCTRTKTYQVLTFFREGKPGCMAAVLSMLLPDSGDIDDKAGQTERNIMYLGINNSLAISSSHPDYSSLKVSISQGSIEGSGEAYVARANRCGSAVVYVDILDSSDNIIETDSTVFEVRSLPLPVMLIAGKQSGTVSRHEIMNARSIELWVPDVEADNYYTLDEYTLATDRSDMNISSVIGNQLLQRQRDMVLDLPEGTAFFITNAMVSTPEGSVFRLPSQTFWLGW